MNISEFSDGVLSYVERGKEIVQRDDRLRQRMRGMKFDTCSVHGIYAMGEAGENQGSIIEPAYLSTSQHFENSDHLEAALAYQMPSWTYSRIANPTVHYLEETLSLLEGYRFPGKVSACATSSGMAAIFLATHPFLVHENNSLKKKINIVASAKCYGGTFMLFQERYARERGVEIRWVKDPLVLSEWERNINQDTRLVFGEMPSNPGLSVFDIGGVANLAHEFEIPLIVDATVATPALLRPLEFGADIVVHSATKSMLCSGFAIAGVLLARHNLAVRQGPDQLKENFALYTKLFPARDFGPNLSPFSALLALNDLRTLRWRMDRLSRNALKIGLFLDQHPQIESVLYPGLKNHPGHAVAARQMWLADAEDDYEKPVNRFGHLLSFTVKGGAKSTRKVFDRLQLIWRATDLGRIKSVATIPAVSTHQQQGDTGRELAQVPDNLIRLSIGAENPGDIIDDLDQALARTG